MREGVEQTTARENLERLNRAVHHHGQAWRELEIPAQDSLADEFLVLTELRTPREAAAGVPLPGSPFIDPRVEILGSAEISVFRAGWNGKHFVLISPGESGAGLDLVYGMADAGEEPAGGGTEP